MTFPPSAARLSGPWPRPRNPVSPAAAPHLAAPARRRPRRPRADPIRTRRRAGFGWGGARTLSRVAEGEVREDLPDDRGIVQRGDQPEAASTMGTRQHVDAERPVHQGRPAPGTRTGGLHPGAIRICGQRRRRGRGLGHGPSIDDYSGAPAGARGQHAMADEQVRFGPRRHRRCGIGSESGRCLSVADYVRDRRPPGRRPPPQPASVAYAHIP